MIAEALDIDQLVEDCKGNNRRAQEQLYRQFYNYAMTIALRYSRDEADAADIMSHAFVKIFKSMHTFDKSKGALQTWIKRIVMNEGLDHLKARERFSKDMELETVEEPQISNTVLERMGADEIMCEAPVNRMAAAQAAAAPMLPARAALTAAAPVVTPVTARRSSLRSNRASRRLV